MKRFERFIGYGVVFAIVLAATLGLYSFSTRAAAPATITGTIIAYVDDAVLDKEFPAVIDAKKQIKQYDDEKNAIKAEYNAKVKALQGSIQRQFEEKTKDLAEAEKQKFVAIYEDMFSTQVAGVKKEYDVKLMEVESKQSQVWKAAVEKIRTVVSAVAQEKGVGIVLKKDVLWFGGLDLTQDVIKKADKK